MKLDDINDALETHFASEDYDSIGGIIIELLDGFPSEGEHVTTKDGIMLTAKKVNKNRIATVTILLPPPKEDDNDTPDSAQDEDPTKTNA